ncbi:hypothetical protein [Colwellia sp. BRX9-1]|uniref:hypothetical protein n=1 Tax=Colwellia sp. BRX9-1 TaxID=2759830 RepID=UPI0015F6313A|nr:hypothetical protein [Colwellia sp. BRX9-1]MBA6352489.1 hypothetical protein [Colwellia sp. BRX9-1]
MKQAKIEKRVDERVVKQSSLTNTEVIELFFGEEEYRKLAKLSQAVVKVAEENVKLIAAEYAAQVTADIAEHESTGKPLFV